MKQNKLHTVKNTGFKTPDSYFDGLEDSLMSQIKLNNKIETTGFSTPNNYFENLDNKILNKIEIKPKVISLFNKRNLLYASSIAAAIVLMISIFTPVINSEYEIEITSIENYLLEEGISNYEIASLLTDGELITDNFIDSNINEDALDAYILQETTIEDLITE